MDNKDLKIQALTERIAELTAAYENRIADLRVEVTVLTNALEQATKEEESA